MAERLLKLKEVRERTSCSESSIRRLMAVGEFPPHIKLRVGRRVAWLESEVQEWIDDCVAAR